MKRFKMKLLLKEIKLIKNAVEKFSQKNKSILRQIHPAFEVSSQNFIHYLALRQLNLKDLQLKLSDRGLSSLGRSESHVMHTLDQVYVGLLMDLLIMSI